MKDDWIVSVLADVQLYADSNNLPVTAKLLQNAIPVIQHEVSSQCPEPAAKRSNGHVIAISDYINRRNGPVRARQ